MSNRCASTVLLGVLLAALGSPLLASTLRFEAIGDATFVTRSAGHAAIIRPDGIILENLRIELVGANAAAMVIARDRLSGTANYFIGKDAQRWRTDLSCYGRVSYKNVYPGIDIVHYGRERRLEHDFVVAPGSPPEQIVLRFHGASSLRIEPNGDLLVNDDVRLSKPRAYQRGGREVASRYHVVDDRVTIEIGDYDRRRRLIIDPVLGYATYLGGTDAEFANAIAVDGGGNAYVTGRTEGTFPTTTGAFRTTRPSGSFGDDIFITKLDSKGAVVYSTYLGGEFTDEGNAIAVDKNGNVYVTGLTTSGDFPTTPGSLKPSFTDDRTFVTKLNAAGNALVYSTFVKGTSINGARAIAVDPAGNAYITGLGFEDFPITPGAFQPTTNGVDAFVAKLNATGSAFLYASFLGGSGFQDEGFAVAADAAGVAYVTGKTDSTDFPTTSGAFQTTAPQGHDAFVARISASGSTLLYSTYLGGRGEDRGLAITADADGHAYVTGYTYSDNFPTVAAIQPLCGCLSAVGGRVQSDAFVTKVAPTGSSLLYSTFYGGIGPDRGFGIGVDSAGAISFGGTTDGVSPSTFPLVDSMKAEKGLFDDAFAVKLNATGSAAVYSTLFGGEGTDFAAAMTVDKGGNVYLAGNTTSPDMPTTAGAHQRTLGGTDDVFVAKIGNAPLPPVPGPKRRAVRK